MLTTKIHAHVDGTGRLFTLLPTLGQQHDSTVARQLMHQEAIRHQRPGRPTILPRYLSADKGNGSRAFRAWLRRRGIQSALLRNFKRRQGRPYNTERYKRRNHIERFFS